MPLTRWARGAGHAMVVMMAMTVCMAAAGTALLPGAALGAQAPSASTTTGTTAAATTQELPALEAQVSALRQRLDSARRTLARAEEAARSVPDDSMRVEGVVLRFRAAAFSPRDRARTERAIEAAAADLRRIFGRDGATALDGLRLLITVGAPNSQRRDPLVTMEVELPVRGRATMLTAASPLEQDFVRHAVYLQAAGDVLRRHPAYRAWGTAFSDQPDATVHYFAHRSLALSASGPARRCARGVVEACRAVLDWRNPSGWWDPGESDTPLRVPVPTVVRESLMRFVLAKDRDAGFAWLQRQEPGDGLALLAERAGVPLDDLLKEWQAAVATSGAARAKAPPVLALSAIGWSALLLGVATRRRPR